MVNRRSSVFIGTSSGGLGIAEAIQLNLDQACEVVIWSQGVFGLSEGTLETLVDKADKFDFAVLVLTPDDMVQSRGKSEQSPRDNVLLELGLFLGVLGRKRTFVVFNRNAGIKLPTDLAGVTLAGYQQHDSGNLQSSVGAACTMIKTVITGQGPRQSGYVSDPKSCQFRVSLVGSASTEIEEDPEKMAALEEFHKQLVLKLDRIGFGINACGSEPLRRVVYRIYADRLFLSSRDQMRQFEHRIRWYWRKGGEAGLSIEPPIGDSREATDALSRQKMEASESDFIVALCGKTGTRSTLERLLHWYEDPNSELSSHRRPLVILSWFGGASAEFSADFRPRIRGLLQEYPELEAGKRIRNWHKKGKTGQLADRLILTLQRLAGSRKPIQ